MRFCGIGGTAFVWLINAGMITSALGQQEDVASNTTERLVVSGTEVSSADFTTTVGTVLTDNALVEYLSRRAANFIINEAGASSFNDVYSVRGLANTPNFSKQAVVLYVDAATFLCSFALLSLFVPARPPAAV